MATTLVREKIGNAINQVRSDSGRAPRVFDDNDTLFSDIELDSLDMATVIVHLEQDLGFDPFCETTATVQTFGDLVELYQSRL